jgi:hypothetical protein
MHKEHISLGSSSTNHKNSSPKNSSKLVERELDGVCRVLRTDLIQLDGVELCAIFSQQ